MKQKHINRRISVASTELLGEDCDEVQAVIAVWPTIDGIGGRSPARTDTVHILAFGDRLPGGCTLIGKTTIRDMVRNEIKGGICGNGKLAKNYVCRFKQLRESLLGAAQDIFDHLPASESKTNL